MVTNPAPPTISWSLCAVCFKSGSRRVIASGTQAEIDAIFDLLVRRGYGLQIVDFRGLVHATTCATLPATEAESTEEPFLDGDSLGDQVQSLANEFHAFRDQAKGLIDQLSDAVTTNELLAVSRAKQVTLLEVQVAQLRSQLRKVRRQSAQTESIKIRLW